MADSPEVAAAVTKPVILPDHFTGSGEEEWRDWFSSFKVVCEINKWSDEMKCKFLGLRLKGHALKVFRELDEDTRNNWQRLQEILTKRLESSQNPELYKSQLLSRKREHGESITTLGNAIRSLARKAYPALDAQTRDELARDQLIRALPNQKLVLHMRHHMPKTLDDAMKMAIEWEAIESDVSNSRETSVGVNSLAQKPELSAAGCGTQSQVGVNMAANTDSELLSVIKEMMQMMKASQAASGRGQSRWRPRHRSQQQGGASNSNGPRCYNCGKLGHISRDCLNKNQGQPSGVCWKCGDPSHMRANCPLLKFQGNGQ